MLPPAARRVSKAVWVKRGAFRQKRWITSGAPPWRPAAILDEYAKQDHDFEGVSLI